VTARPRGVRVILDARPLQDPERAPVTAAYLDGLLSGLDASPVPGESFAFLLASDLDDPTTRFSRLEVVGRRLMPPTRLLRSASLAVDPFLLRGASLGAGWRIERGGAAGVVYHAAAAAIPLGSGFPVVVTLLDLAPWELPRTYQRSSTSRFGQRLRGRLVRDAAAVIVGTEAVGRSARTLLHVRRARLRTIPLAPRPVYRPSAADARGGRPGSGGAARAERERLGLPPRYLVYAGRYDARQDLATLLRALGLLAAAGRPAALAAGEAWPPRVCLLGATPDDRASLARVAAREGVGELLAYTPRLSPERAAALVAGARAALLPVLSEAAGLAAIEALAAGVPVVASAVGPLPEIVGAAGIVAEPKDPERLAAAISTAWTDDAVHERLVDAALARSATMPTWRDVAERTRGVWADVAGAGRLL
jgi:glycosyltransferase involved in cell wall biosynthesis